MISHGIRSAGGALYEALLCFTSQSRKAFCEMHLLTLTKYVYCMKKTSEKTGQLHSMFVSNLEGSRLNALIHLLPSSLFTQVQYSLTSIKGVGRRFSNLICKKAEVDPNKRRECMPETNVYLAAPPPLYGFLKPPLSYIAAGIVFT